MAEYYVGLMSGTSMDALDAVVVEFEGDQPRLIASLNRPLPEDLRANLFSLTSPADNEVERSAQADHLLGRFSAETVGLLLQQAAIDAGQIKAIGSHGQTIRHAPDANPPYTVQIGDGNTIAQLSGITTIADFRRRDLVVGGQGAPLVPAFHSALYRSEEQERVALNLGGMANISILPANPELPVRGFDTGPANVLLDSWCLQQRGEAYDANGDWAASGAVIPGLLQTLADDPYFQRPPPKSTGREYFNLDWLMNRLPEEAAPVDIQATLSELTAITVADAIKHHSQKCEMLIVCGGGAYNTDLMHRLERNLPGIAVISSAKTGIEPRWLEAMAFAWLARQTLHRLTGNLPAVTGASEAVILGAIYPGTQPS